MNGTQVSTSAATGAIATSTNPLSIGSDPHLRPVLQRPDRRRPRLQHRPHPRPDPNRHDNPGRDRRLPTRRRRRRRATLTATAISSSRVDLSWGAATDNVAVTGYHIERCQGAGCTSFAEIATTAATTTYSDTSTAAGTSYSYRVRANDAAPNLGPYSNTATATTPSPDTTPPSAPGTLTATAISSEPRRSQLGRGDRQRRGHRLPHRALPGRRLHQLRRDRDHRRRHQLQRHQPPPPAPATATASAPTTPPPTSAPTPTPPPPRPRCPAGRRRWRRMRLMRGRGRRLRMRRGTATTARSANTTWAAAGKYGKALSFNGTSSRVTVPDSASLHLSSAMTLEAWVDPATRPRCWRDVIYKGNDNYYLEGTSDTGGRPAGGRHLRPPATAPRRCR